MGSSKSNSKEEKTAHKTTSISEGKINLKSNILKIFGNFEFILLFMQLKAP